MLKYIKIYGERHCGTNYLEELLKANLESSIILKFSPGLLYTQLLKNIPYDIVQDLLFFADRNQSLGWKHGCPCVREINRFKKTSLVVVTITKNPYAFLLSLHTNPYHIKGSRNLLFVDFLKQKWILRNRDLCKRRYLPSPVDLWNLKNKAYLNLQSEVACPVINLKYETLVENPARAMKQISDMTNLEVNSTFRNFVQSTKGSELTFKQYQAYYLERKWLDKLDFAAVSLINRMLDESVVDGFNYEILDPNLFLPATNT